MFYKLDTWEDNLRRRMRFVKNPHGTTHPEAILEPIAEEGFSFTIMNVSYPRFTLFPV